MKTKAFIFMIIILLIVCSGYTFLCLLMQSLIQEYIGNVEELPLSGFFYTFILLKPLGIGLFSLVVVAVLSSIAYLFFFLLCRPLRKLKDAMFIVANGEYDLKLPVRGKNEITTLHSEFNRMVKNFGKKLAMQKYISKSTVDMIDNLKTGEFTQQPVRKKISIFFSDVRGFTAFSEKHDPFHVVDTINSIFNIQVEIINKHEGDIDKFVGDEIMATFPSPAAAFRAASEIQKKITAYNKRLPTPLPVGIGINYGDAVVGAIGAADSLDWTAVGNTVNEAARLCSAAEGGHIYMSEEAFKRLRTKKAFKMEEIKVKGKTNKLKVYIF